MKRILPICVILFAGCGKAPPPPPSPPVDPTSQVARLFARQLETGTISELDGECFIQVLGSAALAPLEAAPLPSSAASRAIRARLIAFAARFQVRGEQTVAQAERLASDDDAAVRIQARNALFWSATDDGARQSEWVGRLPLCAALDLKGEHWTLTREDAKARLAPAVKGENLDLGAIPERPGAGQPVPAAKKALAKHAAVRTTDTEALGWLVQAARAGDRRSWYRLVDYLEKEPCIRLGRTPSAEEAETAYATLAGVSGRSTRRYDDWMIWVEKDREEEERKHKEEEDKKHK